MLLLYLIAITLYLEFQVIKPLPKKYNLEDTAVINSIYEDYWEMLFALCYHKTKDMPASEEIVQDIFVSLWKRKGELIVADSIKGYLIKSAKTGIIKYYKSKVKSTATPVADCNLCEQKGFGEDVLQHNEAIVKLLEEEVEIIVNELPCQCQKVYRLSREKHLTTNEIAAKLNISQKTVKHHLTKALAYIQKKIPPVLHH